MKRYQESIEKSAECLRLAIPLMSQQPVALHPVSYSIWYEYVAGINKPLRAAIDRLAEQGKVLDEATTEDIYQTYIAPHDQKLAHQVTVGFTKVMSDVSKDAAHAGEYAYRLGNRLGEWAEAHEKIESAFSPQEISKLLSGTRELQGVMVTLQERLDASRKEIEKLQSEVNRAREEALADELTGLVNRRGFEIALAACLASQPPLGQSACLLFADIDHFKRVNDAYGHLVGDKVLQAVAQIIKANVKGKDTAARFGGEEFVILLPDTHIDGAMFVAEKIRSTIESSRVWRKDTRQQIAQVTVSFGVACHLPGESAKAFVERGDKALYASKTAGRNRVTLATAGEA